MTPKVYNKNDPNRPLDAIYIGRGSIWGNPYSHKKGTKAKFLVSSRYEAIRCFEEKVIPDLDLKPLIGKNLVCFCKPKRCHGDVLLKYAKQLESGLSRFI